MTNIKVKICGIRESVAALEAEKNGADYIGIVFCKKSKRCVSIEESLKILESLKASTNTVALFANDSRDYINDVLKKTNFKYVQFHGNETDDDCKEYGLPYIKGVSSSEDGFKDLDVKFPNASAFIFDSHGEDGLGGTGKTFDWKSAVIDTKKPVIIAGGLNCDNVEDAINAFLPYGVDVSSGVESPNGEKDINLIKKFLKKVKK